LRAKLHPDDNFSNYYQMANGHLFVFPATARASAPANPGNLNCSAMRTARSSSGNKADAVTRPFRRQGRLSAIRRGLCLTSFRVHLRFAAERCRILAVATRVKTPNILAFRRQVFGFYFGRFIVSPEAATHSSSTKNASPQIVPLALAN
jgi:hypothetical protein